MNLNINSGTASLKDVVIRDPFWSRRMETVRTEMIPYQWNALNDNVPGAEPSYCIQNFKIAAGKADGKHGGYVFQDSDIAKWLEAVAYSLMWHKDAELESTADSAIELICSAQLPDGYMDTYYIINGLDQRFTNLKENHELYCLGHMTEAAVAYYEATGKERLLQAVIRCVDLVDSLIGPEEGKLHGYPGHEILEMALIRLYHVTREEKHLRLARYFIDERGKEPLFFEEELEKRGQHPDPKSRAARNQYHQADIPVREQQYAEGHAVRAVYLYCGMADVARETADESLLKACKRLWNDMTNRQMYLTGGIGATRHGEAFTFDYDLPNETNYAETCASIGLMFFARRMLGLESDSRYADVMEQALYNGIISGMSLDGKRFFYVNPLEAIPEASKRKEDFQHIKIERQKWFGCACCPPNLARLLTSLGRYVYSVQGETLYQNLYIGGTIAHTFNCEPVRLELTASYPWEENIEVTVHTERPIAFTYALRIPGWCREFTLLLNGKKAFYAVDYGYAKITREWAEGDHIQLVLRMPVRRITANPHVRSNVGKIAIMRGPLVYCVEEADNGSSLHGIFLSDRDTFTEQFEPDLLGGIVSLTSTGQRLRESGWDKDVLYDEQPVSFEPCTLKWIPYYSWANRTPGEMVVWVHQL